MTQVFGRNSDIREKGILSEELFINSEITILIVDDNPVNVKMEQVVLGKAGYSTAGTTDGEACFEMARNQNPDLILLDINMSKISGIEICKTLKKNKGTAEIPVIFVTASTDDDTLKEAFEAGGSDYVRKPVNKIELLARINSALTHKKLVERLIEKEKLEGVMEMAGAVCHEMNQPLQVVSGYSELLLMDIPPDSPAYGNVKKIKAQVGRMREITRKLMCITRYETRPYIKETKIIDIDTASGAET